jgi:sugar phosphate isomerase/epimerase
MRSPLYNDAMKTGISTATFFGKILTEDALYKIKSYGVDIAEVFLTTFYEYEADFVDFLTTRLAGVEVYSVHSLNNHYEPELFNRVERTRKDGEKILDKVLYGAKKLNAKYYTFHGPSRLKITEYKLDYERIGLIVAELVERASRMNIKISYENVSWAFYNSPGFFTKIKSYAPELTGCLDIKQAMQAYRNRHKISGDMTAGEYDALIDYTLSYIEDMDKALVNVHISDYDLSGRLCAPGRGVFDFDKLIDKLKKHGYDGPLIIELYSGDYKSFDEIGQSVDYINNILGGLNEQQLKNQT